MAAMTQHAIILFAHGARDPLWAAPFEKLASLVAARRPDQLVRLAFLELMTPNLADCVASLATENIDSLTIVPAFMARGAHLRRDLPLLVAALREQHPHLQISVTEALGETDAVLGAMAEWIAASQDA